MGHHGGMIEPRLLAIALTAVTTAVTTLPAVATRNAAGAAPAPAPALVLVGGTIYPAPDATPLLDGVIVVERGRIVAVGGRDEVTIPAAARRIDCTGAAIVAGFQNSHVHFTEEHWANAARQPAAKLTGHLQAMLMRYGFTHVVDTGSYLPNTSALRRRIESGEVAGPRILTTGAGLFPPDGVPYYLKETLPEGIWKRLPQPRNPDEATRVVRENVRGGADLVKVFTGTWIARDTVLPMPEPIAVAAVAAAHAAGKPVFSHPSNLAGLEVALSAKVDVLAHAIEDTRGMTPDHLRRMKEQNIALVPTLALLGKSSNLWAILDQVREYGRLGGQILFGTDVGYSTDYDPSREYVLMGTAGLSWREILATLTTAPAQRFGENRRRGRIAPGMDGDLVVLATNPLQDVRAFSDVRVTIRAGRVIYSR
jgi:imidazolonepropionase-like amidohydrolase